MSDTTAIQWTNHTWNPWRGCTKIHPGQDPSIVTRTKTWKDPLRWQKNAKRLGILEMVFTCSWSDWFHKDADTWRSEAWSVIRQCPNLIFQILTKRPERIADHLPGDWNQGYQNVWLGSSLDPSDKYGMALFHIPAMVRFLSLEPLLGPVSLGKVPLHWVIVGGESGHGARPCNIEWIGSIVEQCKAAQVPCFVKQLGSKPVWTHVVPGCSVREFDEPLPLKHPKGGDPSEWPEDLRAREFPHV